MCRSAAIDGGPGSPRGSLHIAMEPGGYRRRRSAPKGQQKVEYAALESLVFFEFIPPSQTVIWGGIAR